MKLDGKKETIVDSPCKVVEERDNGNSYYIKDLQTNRIYLRNRKFIKMCEKDKAALHKLKKMEVEADRNIKHPSRMVLWRWELMLLQMWWLVVL